MTETTSTPTPTHRAAPRSSPAPTRASASRSPGPRRPRLHRRGRRARRRPRRHRRRDARGRRLDVFLVPLDVADDASVAAAADLLERRGGGLDVLVNNAGITGSMPQEPTVVHLDTLRTVLETNVFGVIRTTNAMLPMLRRSTAARIVNVSSGVGSLARQSAAATDGGRRAGRRGVLAVEDLPQRGDAAVRARARRHRHPRQRRVPRLRRDRPERVRRSPHHRAGCGDTDPARDAARRRAHRGFFEDAGVVPW